MRPETFHTRVTNSSRALKVRTASAGRIRTKESSSVPFDKSLDDRSILNFVSRELAVPSCHTTIPGGPDRMSHGACVRQTISTIRNEDEERGTLARARVRVRARHGSLNVDLLPRQTDRRHKSYTLEIVVQIRLHLSCSLLASAYIIQRRILRPSLSLRSIPTLRAPVRSLPLCLSWAF